MKAVCIEKPGDIHIKEVPKPILGKDSALVKIQAMSVCGSDVAAYHFKHPNCSYPLIIGHEIAGIIEEISGNANNFKVGDRVVLDPYIYCGHCYSCIQGRTNCCESLKVLGVQIDGAMSEYFVHPTKLLVKVPDNIPWELAPLSEPLTIALHALHRIQIKKGEHVVINGAGAIGLLAALSAKVYGAIPILLDVVDGRLAKARECGIEITINVANQDPIAEIAKYTNNRMAETVIEASGAGPAIANTLKYAAYTGRIALTGWPKGDVQMSTSLITKKELQVLGSRTSAHEFEEALQLISENKVDVKQLVSEVVSLDELPEAIRNQDANPAKYLKIVGVVR